MKASLIDFSFASIDSEKRNMTFIFIFKLKEKISQEKLLSGAAKAFQFYPQSNCALKGYRWVNDSKEFKVEDTDIESFVNRPLNIESQRGIEQTLINETTLATKFHHATCDGYSALLWLKAQLTDSQDHDELKLKISKKSITKSAYSFNTRSDVFGQMNTTLGQKRKWLSFELKIPEHNSNLYSYNDLLIYKILKNAEKWNQLYKRDQKISLYIPYNIRQNLAEGFGNGASRIKIYSARNDLNQEEYCQYIREQIQWCKNEGLWSMPNVMKFFKFLPTGISKNILKKLSSHPSMDFCSMLFSHMKETQHFQGLFNQIADIEIVSPLVEHYSVAIIAISNNDSTKITLTWDESQVSELHIQNFKELFH